MTVDREAFEQELGALLPGLLRFATVLCGGPDPAEEVLQDVVVKAHARWGRIRDLDHPQAYLRRMIVNEHLSWRRKWSRLVPQAELREPPVSGPDFADTHADRAELVAELARLPRRQQTVLVLRYFEGLTDPEIAEVLGCGASTVRSHASSGLARLRVQMAPPARIPNETEDSRAY
ncbi:SigE family RNA polymerase sigma factor [uncultured Friedmanniella sp.]|uniref:SigE family RNA polymerase sigma factor n=1 Tax=uncultured Friedmanniella sp. TaxID=335381 RepID=UPI0035C94C79